MSDMKYSGNSEKFDSGATREVKEGRGLPALIYPGVLERLSKWLELGGKNHGFRNWERGLPSESFLNSLYRHVIAYHKGDRSEDHLSAMLFNVQGLLFNEEQRPDLIDLPNYVAATGNENKSTKIVTSTGGTIDPVNPNPDDINIIDIFKGLSNACRYTGQLKHGVPFYSVAQHSVLAAIWAEHDSCSVEVELMILMHDFSEAYLSDIAKPVKQVLPDYQKLEARIQDAIYLKFMGHLPSKAVLELIKTYDRWMLSQEIAYLMEPHPIFEPWTGDALGLSVPGFVTEELEDTWSIEESYTELKTVFNRLMEVYLGPGNDQLAG